MAGMLILTGLLIAVILFDLAVWRWGVDSSDSAIEVDGHRW